MNKTPPPSFDRVQKVLANLGLGSRREIERWIAARRISVNGQIIDLGHRVVSTDIIRVDGRIITRQTKEPVYTRVLIYNKPEGQIVSNRDDEGRDLVFNHLPRLHKGRWIAVGRLDINTSGLLMFTTNGELADKLMHPSSALEREYSVRLLGKLDQATMETLRHGVNLEDGEAKVKHLSELGGEGINRWYQIIITEGRNREVRRLFDAVGFKVSRLIRTRFGSVSLLRNMRRGEWRDLDRRDLMNLAESVNVRVEVRHEKPHERQKKFKGLKYGGKSSRKPPNKR